MIYRLHPKAQQELGRAARFYRRDGGVSVAVRFLDEFERLADLLAENPEIGIPLGGERRWFPFSGFPYSMIYRPTETGILILVVRHQHRDPDFGDRRR